MKKNLIFAAIACMAGHAVNAQELVIGESSSFGGEYTGAAVVAQSLSSSGKSILTTREYDRDNGQYQIRFYNPDLSVFKTLNITMPSYRYESYDEVAVAGPKGSQVDPNDLTWQREIGEYDRDETRYWYPEPHNYFDYDNSAGYGVDAIVTQTLFNDDSQWEYLMPIIEEYSQYGTPREYTYYDGDGNRDTENIHLRRSYTHSARCVGYNVVSENGSIVMSIKTRHANISSFEMYRILTWSGKKYFTTYESYYDEDGKWQHVSTLYVFDTYTTSIQEVSSVNVRQPMAIMSGNGIDVTLDEADTNSDLILSNMAGQVVGQKHIGAGETKSRMNAANMPKGFYNLTLRRNGQVLNNQKLMVR